VNATFNDLNLIHIIKDENILQVSELNFYCDISKSALFFSFCKKNSVIAERWEIRPQSPLPPAAKGFALRSPLIQ